MSGRVSYYGGIVKNGLIIDLDAGKLDSYNRTNTKWNDISGNGNNGTLTNFGSQTIYNSDNGGSIVFDGTNDEVICPLSSSIQSINTTNELTLSVFFKINFLNQYKDIVGINKLSGENPFVFRIHENNNYYFDCYVGSSRCTITYTGTSNDFYNQWVQLTGTIGGGKMYAYKNGIQNGNLNVSGNIKTLDSNFGSLYDMGYGPFSGNIGQILLYNKALSASEILQNYNALKGRYNL